MHPTVERLLECAKAATAQSDAPVLEIGDLAPRMRISAGRLTNWKARGVSKEGAIQAEALFGCTSQWILYGRASKTDADHQPVATGDAQQATVPAAAGNSVVAFIRQIAALVPRTRRTAVSIIHGVMDEPEEAHAIAQELSKLLGATFPEPVPKLSNDALVLALMFDGLPEGKEKNGRLWRAKRVLRGTDPVTMQRDGDPDRPASAPKSSRTRGSGKSPGQSHGTSVTTKGGR